MLQSSVLSTISFVERLSILYLESSSEIYLCSTQFFFFVFTSLLFYQDVSSVTILKAKGTISFAVRLAFSYILGVPQISLFHSILLLGFTFIYDVSSVVILSAKHYFFWSKTNYFYIVGVPQRSIFVPLGSSSCFYFTLVFLREAKKIQFLGVPQSSSRVHLVFLPYPTVHNIALARQYAGFAGGSLHVPRRFSCFLINYANNCFLALIFVLKD